MQQKSLLNLFAIPAVSTLVAAGIALAQSGGDGTTPSPQNSPTAGPSPGSTPTSQPAQTGQRIVYEAPLASANTNVSQGTGRATIVIDGDQAGIFIQGTGLSPETLQMQHIHSGSACATQSNDTNGDGYVDAVEGTAASGPPVLPLTLDLAQLAQSGTLTSASNEESSDYPTTSQAGGFTYIASVPVSTLQSALSSQPGASPTASPTASPGVASDSSGIEGRVIEIHGVSSNVQLPSTVQSLPGSTANASLPVACGVITRSSD